MLAAVPAVEERPPATAADAAGLLSRLRVCDVVDDVLTAKFLDQTCSSSLSHVRLSPYLIMECDDLGNILILFTLDVHHFFTSL